MKNVKIVVKLRRLIKSLAVTVFTLALFAASSAFKASSTGGPKKTQAKDTLFLDKKDFKSLFSTSYFDPAKPYVAQLNPKAVPFVQSYIQSSGKELERMKIWGKPYFDMYDGILSEYGLPKELKYLSVIESALVPNIVSVAGAVGPWQIMAEEARRWGLRVGGRSDERTNFYKSTHAAAKILTGLHRQFNDWLLVIAAYNCGAGRVRQAIRRSGSNNFWDLQAYLPQETRNHVKRFIGTHYIFEGSGGLTTMTAAEVMDYDLNSTEDRDIPAAADGQVGSVEVSGKYKGSVIAKSLGMDASAFSKMNPNFDKSVAKGNTYTMRLPAEKLFVFANNKHAILDECIKSLLNY